MYTLYRAITSLASPFIPLLLRRRLAQGKEDGVRLQERLGHASVARPAGKIIWIHAASVGEANATLPLIDALLNASPALHVLLTTVTVTSAALMKARLPARAIHQFAPVDTLPAVQSFLRHWNPDVAIWVDSELWPNLIMQTHQQGAVMGIINARMSERSFRNWRYARAFIGRLLACFTLCFAQSRRDADRLQALGIAAINGIGNLKYDALELPCNEEGLQQLRAETGERPHWLAASTHSGEEEMIGRVHSSLKRTFPDLLTIIIPRHAKRGSDIAAQLSSFAVAQRSRHQPITPATDIYLADTMGELGLFYRLAPVVFIGKSLGSRGGQNPLEAAHLGCAIIVGPHTGNFSEIYQELEGTHACIRVKNEQALTAAVKDLLTHNDAAARLSAGALAHVRSHAGQVAAIMKVLQPYLP